MKNMTTGQLAQKLREKEAKVFPSPPRPVRRVADHTAQGIDDWHRDHGIPFDPHSRKRPDFTDPDTRKRGRGLGLEIIHRVMRAVAYYPSTPLGNITVLEWDPRTPAQEKVSSHV